MSRIYSNTNRIKFTDIPEKYAIPRGFRAKQSEVHSAVVTYVYEHYRNTKKYKQQVVDALNRLTYCIMQNEPPSYTWISTDPINTMPDLELDLVEEAIGDFYLTPEAIEWNVSPSDDSVEVTLPEPASSGENAKLISTPIRHSEQSITKQFDSSTVVNRPLKSIKSQQKLVNSSTKTIDTPKEDLYIQSPKYPSFDTSKVWMSANVNGDNLVIYTTLPEIPTKQNEISITTNLSMMTDSELMNLYPNQVIHTRAQQMYERYEGIDYDEDLGCILPIQGFTKEQVVDNIIRYPHLFRLRKIGPDNNIHKFFSTIEINDELVPVTEIWDQLPESNLMPRDPEFVKEYVVRRYLLERDNGKTHKYNMLGVLEPFLTLFMPEQKYIEKGYTDVLSIVKQCVTSRIHYKQSRSPILRRIESNV